MLSRRLACAAIILVLLLPGAILAYQDRLYAIRDAKNNVLGYIDTEFRVLDRDREVIGYINAENIQDEDYVILAYREKQGQEERLKNTSMRTEYYIEAQDSYTGRLSDSTFSVVALWDSGRITDDFFTTLATYDWNNPDTDDVEGLVGNEVFYFLLYFTDLLD